MTPPTAMLFGASGGIGPELAGRLHARGYRLTLVDRDRAATAALAETLGEARVLAADLADRAALAGLCETIEAAASPLDVAVINAGIIHPTDLLDTRPADIDAQLDVNLRAATHLLRACGRRMAASGGGHLLCTVSMGGIVAVKGSATYSATKFGLRGLLMGLRDELLPQGVRVSGIYPSGVDTPMLRYEARHGGSALNFVSTPQTVADIGDAFDKALDTGRLEVYPNWGDSLSGRLVGSLPWLLPKLAPALEWLGERGRRRYLARIDGD